MKLYAFKETYKHGGHRITIPKRKLDLQKIDAFQILKLEKNLKETRHINKLGNVVCVVLSGWMEAEVEGKKYPLTEKQGILFSKGEKHRVIKGEGLMLSISSEDYTSKLGTKYYKSKTI